MSRKAVLIITVPDATLVWSRKRRLRWVRREVAALRKNYYPHVAGHATLALTRELIDQTWN